MGRLGAVIHKAFRSAGRDWVYFLSILGQTQRCISRLCIRPSDQAFRSGPISEHCLSAAYGDGHLVGTLCREGLVDTGGLAAWLIRFLKNSDASAAGIVAVMPLLHLLLPVSRNACLQQAINAGARNTSLRSLHSDHRMSWPQA